MEKQKISTECGACGGTGLYCGFTEAKETAVVCLQCNGTGEKIVEYTPFSGRKEKMSVKTVFLSRGNFIGTGVGAHGEGISYESFKSGEMPT